MKRGIVCRSILVLIVGWLVLVTPALAAQCGGGVPCSCGDLVIADHTLNCGVDPVTVESCRDLPETTEFVEGGLIVGQSVNLNLGNCTIRGTGAGIGIRLGEGASVEAGQIVGFASGVTGFNPEIVRQLRVADTSVGGIVVTGARFVERNVVERSGGIGIANLDSVQDVVRQNRIEDTEGCGLVVRASQTLVDRNLVTRGGECGLLITGLSNLVTRNQVKYTQGGPGFLFVDAQQNHVSLNSSVGAEGPNGSGFVIQTLSERNTFERNLASNNEAFGMEDRTSGPVFGDDTYVGNRCMRNGLGPSSPAGLCE